MKKFFFVLSYVLSTCLLAPFFTSCDEEDVLKALVGEVRLFDYERVAEAGKGGISIETGDSICGLIASLELREVMVAPENLGKVAYTPMGPTRQETRNGILHLYRDFLGSDGNKMHAESWAPETLAEKAGVLGHIDSYDLVADPAELVSLDENRATLKAVASMVFNREGKEVGRVSVKPNYNHVTDVKPDEPNEPEPLTVKVDTVYMYEKGEGYFKIEAVRSDGKVLVDYKALPLYSDGAFHGSNIYHAAAPARFDSTVGNNGLETSVEPQPDRSYSGKVLDEYTTATLRYGCYRVKTSFIGDGEGTSTTEAVIDYWVMEYTFHDPESGWTLTTHSIELTHEVTQNELQGADGTLLDAYGKPHHLMPR